MALKELPLYTVYLTISGLDKLQSDVRYHVAIRAHEALRFQLFDLGKLLLRNDTDGDRNKKWRQKANEIIEASLNTFLPPIVDGKLPQGQEHHLDIKQKNDHLFFIFNGIEDRLVKLGTSVLESDQHEFYKEELGTALFRCQKLIIEGLKAAVESGNPDFQCLKDIEWATYCCNHALSRPQYEFSVRETIERERVEKSPRVRKSIDGLWHNTFAELCLVVDHFNGKVAHYEKDIDSPAVLISKRDQAYDFIIEGEDLLCPVFDWKAKNLDYNKEFFKAIDAAVPQMKSAPNEQFVDNEYNGRQNDAWYHIVNAPSEPVDNNGKSKWPDIPPTPVVIELLLRGMAKVERHRNDVAHIIVGTAIADELLKHIDRFGTKLESKNELEPIADLYNAKIYSTERIDANLGWVLAAPQFLGVLPVRADGHSGLCILNPKGIVKVIL